MSELMKREQFNIETIDNDLYSALKNSVYPGAKDNSIAMVLSYCKSRGLDPLQKPVHIVPMFIKDAETGKGEQRDVVMPGIGLYRIQAQRSGAYAGQTDPEFGEDVNEKLTGVEITYPKWCKIIVKKMMSNGEIVEFAAKEYWKENYATAGRDSLAPNAMWKKRPYAQLAKCTEAQALRKAFPDILGCEPTAEEMEGKHFENVMNKNSNASELNKKLGLTIDAKPEPEKPNQEVNPETGEVKTNDEEETMTLDHVKFMIDAATTIQHLMNAVDFARALPEEDRKQARIWYKEKEKQINGN